MRLSVITHIIMRLEILINTSMSTYSTSSLKVYCTVCLPYSQEKVSFTLTDGHNPLTFQSA